MGVFTLKELEKILPAVASINAMQVKDVLQGLQDENLIRVEKIGSGNWYWCFTSDAKKLKENTINTLKAEESKLIVSIAEAERQIEEETATREDDNEMLEGNGMDRKALLEAYDALLKKTELLDKELACYSDSDPAEVQRKMEEVINLKASTIRWTDNIEALECMLGDLTKDRHQTSEIMQNACGDEYVPGEGLKEL
jgi:transcription initiation factor IIE alpha subunit